MKEEPFITMQEEPLIIRFITTIVDDAVEARRDQQLGKIEKAARGKRCQPPMIERRRMIIILRDWFAAAGVPDGTVPASKMNQMVRAWINERTIKSTDARKSRKKKLGPDAVRVLLKQIYELR
jgi:hypothetical protein